MSSHSGIGTSLLYYASKESFYEGHRDAATPENILGVLSLIFWSLVLIISIKYVAFAPHEQTTRGRAGVSP